jgi:hypothetical protein
VGNAISPNRSQQGWLRAWRDLSPLAWRPNNRNYRERFKVLADFNPDEDLYIGDNGAWQWTKPKSALAEQLKAHFVNRREDG